jgi:hypothetical protein
MLIESEIQKNLTLSRSGEQSGLQLSFREVYGKTEPKKRIFKLALQPDVDQEPGVGLQQIPKVLGPP